MPSLVVNLAAAGRALLFGLFFVSGVTGLLYEVVWTRMLTLVMGNTVFATSTVLAAFMGGLALGSWTIGRLADRWAWPGPLTPPSLPLAGERDLVRERWWPKGPLGLYGVLEGLLGLYCLALPLLLQSLVPLYRVLYQSFSDSLHLLTIVQFVFSGLMILIPATLMGGTLPALSKALVERPDQIGSSVGRLYAVNSLGAVVGALATGMVFLPTFGVRASLYGAATVNIAIGLLAFALTPALSVGDPPEAGARLPTPYGGTRWRGRKGEGEVEGRGEGEVQGARVVEGEASTARLALIALTLSGAAALMYEVAWTRVLALLLGPSVPAFSLMLAAFITGLALGSWLFSRVADREQNLLPLMGILQFGTAFSVVAFVPLMDKAPALIRGLFRSAGDSNFHAQLITAAIAFAIMLVPTTCLGAVFPLGVKLYSRSLAALGRRVGGLYAGNALGAVVGSLAAGFLLVPLVGLQKTLLIAALINGAIGLFLLLASGFAYQTARLAMTTAATCVLVGLVFLISPWDVKALMSGPYLYIFQDEAEASRTRATDELLYYREGLTGTVAVKQRGNSRFLIISGKVDAGTKPLDMQTQVMLGEIPLLLARAPQDVLVIGLGSGVTAGTVARYPVKTIDTVEVSYEVREAAALFAGVNQQVLNDPRARVIVQDARNHLLLTDRQYDVIISEPSNPWMAGIGNLYTQEFFELARTRLRPHGLMGQWIGAYNIPTPVLKRIIRTYAEVFPHVGIWLLGRGDLLLVGSMEPLRTDLDAVKARLAVHGSVVRDAVQGAQILTDDQPVLEYELPKAARSDVWPANAAWVKALRNESKAATAQSSP